MAKKSIEDVINSLSEEEKEKFKDLIKKALEEDRIIKANTERALNALKSFSEHRNLLQSIKEEAATLRKLRDEIQSMKYTLYLTAIPDNKFYRA